MNTSMTNDTTRPLVFIGSNSNIFKFQELVEDCGYNLVGIVDDDYYDQKQYLGIPVIAREADLVEEREHWKHYQFVCMTNWYPDQHDPIVQRNRDKRTRQIQLLEQQQFTLATIISPRAQVSRRAKVGGGSIIDSFSVLDPGAEVGKHTLIYDHVILGPSSRVGNDCVLQRYAGVAGETTVGDGSYLSMNSGVLRVEVEVGAGTFIHPGIFILRGTEPNEVVSLAGRNLRKVYPSTTTIE